MNLFDHFNPWARHLKYTANENHKMNMLENNTNVPIVTNKI